ncbi:general transcription factor II-I repeat domain-containing protein 2A-like [Haplochromis burtoni]|uniref:general transcription factor II-I repeat domain-containing protein 2A-like n=1 Tax=Haplochromis burtoni TaxID=8153 RepID=UPI001C2D91F8|nr:general transcription factor II-I repeat domain-containing protein 2A-like [Haplochromis burtoni]
MVSDVQLSRHTVEHRMSDINTAIESQLHSDLQAYNVMKPVMEIVNYIRTHALNHRQFKNLIAELDQGLPGDLPLHCTVRWLSKGQVLSRFFELLDAVKLFMEEKDKDYPELSHLKWIMDLAFLVDMLCHLDRLNLTLQGKLKMLQSVCTKLKLFKMHNQKGDLTHFPALLKASRQVASAALSKQRARYATLVENLHESFVTRFHDLQLKRPQITFLVNAFNADTGCLKVPLVTDEAAAELELIDPCEEDQFRPLSSGKVSQWKNIPMSNGLRLRYRQCLGQHTSASFLYPETCEIQASICSD